MWERLWRWLLTPPYDQPEPLDGNISDTPGQAPGDGLLPGDSRSKERNTILELEDSNDAVL